MPTTKRCHPVCIGTKWLFALLFFVVTVASIMGVIETHIVNDQLVFGGTNSSFAILAFVAALYAFSRQFMTCMKPCEVCEA